MENGKMRETKREGREEGNKGGRKGRYKESESPKALI